MVRILLEVTFLLEEERDSNMFDSELQVYTLLQKEHSRLGLTQCRVPKADSGTLIASLGKAI